MVPFYVAHLASLDRSPPFTVSVDGSFTGNGNVLALACIDGRCGAILLLSGLFIYLDKVILVFREYDDGILLKMQVDVVFQRDESREIDTCRHVQMTSSHFAQFADSFGKGLGVHSLSVSIASTFQNTYMVVWNYRKRRLLHFYWQVLIILAVVFGFDG